MRASWIAALQFSGVERDGLHRPVFNLRGAFLFLLERYADKAHGRSLPKERSPAAHETSTDGANPPSREVIRVRRVVSGLQRAPAVVRGVVASR